MQIASELSVQTEPYWFETGLLQENMQGRFPFSNRFRWKQNLNGLRHACCTKICKAANCSQPGFGGKRTLLVGDMLIAGECATPLPVLNQISVEREPHWLETCSLQGNVQSCRLFTNRFRWKKNRAAHNNRFGIMAAGSWSHRQQFATVLSLRREIIN